MNLSAKEVEALGALACGIIPADERDPGASSLKPGEHLARKFAANAFASGLLKDLSLAETMSVERFGLSIQQLDGDAVAQLLATLRDRTPALFKFVRMETCALYLSQPATWQRIGFPGPSIEQGGYPDFDQPQECERQKSLLVSRRGRV